nr:hypothetical protein BaRGS_033427 [Batillaria attramentaria]
MQPSQPSRWAELKKATVESRAENSSSPTPDAPNTQEKLSKDVPGETHTAATKHHRINTVNLVFALHSNIVESAIDSYHALAKQLIVALRHEEQRSQYLSTQSKTIRAVFDEVAALPEDSAQNPYRLILQRSQIANELKQVYASLVESGIVSLHINRWVEVNFCLPHKVHVIATGSKVLHLEPKEVEGCLSALRPYHGLLLMQPEDELLDSLPIDSSPALVRLVKMISPVKNLQLLSLDTDLSLSQVFVLACHLVYWGKAMVIYPVCESNEYILSPVANTLANSSLVEEFVQQFPGKSLHAELSDFSLPCQLREKRDYLDYPQLQAQRAQMVVEESLFSYLMDDHSNLERAPSMSDVASVNSDESVGIPVASDGSAVGEETKVHWQMQNSLLKEMTPADRAAVLQCRASKSLEDLQLFDCPLYHQLRMTTWPSEPPLQTKLYGPLRELERTADFMLRTELPV